jgi:hypothetical protein
MYNIIEVLKMQKFVIRQLLTRGTARDLTIFLIVFVLFLFVLNTFLTFTFLSSLIQTVSSGNPNIYAVEIAPGLSQYDGQVVEELEHLFGKNALAPFGSVYVATRHGGATVEAVAVSNLSVARQLLPISKAVAQGSYPEYGVYLVEEVMQKQGLSLGDEVNVYVGNATVPMKVVGVLYNSFFAAEGFAIIPLSNLTEMAINLMNVALYYNQTALQEFRAFLSSHYYEGLPLTGWFLVYHFSALPSRF